MLDASVENGPSWIDGRIMVTIMAILHFLPPPDQPTVSFMKFIANALVCSI